MTQNNTIQNNIEVEEDFYENGQIKLSMVYFNGKLHNPSAPAIQRWYENGEIAAQSYYINNKMSNVNGPANLGWDENGKLKTEEYWFDGAKYRSLEYVRREAKMHCLI